MYEEDDLTLDDLLTEEELDEFIVGCKRLYENSAISNESLGMYDSDFF